jgi:hypothetical protein
MSSTLRGDLLRRARKLFLEIHRLAAEQKAHLQPEERQSHDRNQTRLKAGTAQGYPISEREGGRDKNGNGPP